MDITLNLNCNFDTVFLINGKLFESGEIIYGEKEVVYITVLPLSALMLPYTVKMVGGSVKSNLELVKCYSLESDKFFIRFSPRYSFVYSVPVPKTPGDVWDIAEKFFNAVVEKKTDEARRCLTGELNAGIDDKSLLSFFDGFKDLIAHDAARGLYYLIDQKNHGVLYNFVLKNGTIDNIMEL